MKAKRKKGSLQIFHKTSPAIALEFIHGDIASIEVIGHHGQPLRRRFRS
jgi:hypothetical protein